MKNLPQNKNCSPSCVTELLQLWRAFNIGDKDDILVGDAEDYAGRQSLEFLSGYRAQGHRTQTGLQLHYRREADAPAVFSPASWVPAKAVSPAQQPLRATEEQQNNFQT